MSAVMSLSSLWRMMAKPPRLQLSACSTSKCCPHVQVTGSPSGFQPYLRHRLSRNAPLWRLKRCSSIGRTFNQWEASFSCERIIACFCGLSKVCRSCSASSLIFSLSLVLFELVAGFPSFLLCMRDLS